MFSMLWNESQKCGLWGGGYGGVDRKGVRQAFEALWNESIEFQEGEF